MFESLTTIFALLSSWAASTAVIIAQITPQSLIEDGNLRLVCVCGGLGGSLLSALLWPPKNGTGREFGLKVMSSSLVAIIFTPMLFHWEGVERTADTVLAASGAIGMLGVGVIRALKPLVEKGAAKVLRGLFARVFGPIQEDEEKKP